MKVLGIESSCDETAASVVEDGRILHSNVVVSQINIHAEYGGVIPEIAARNHIEVVIPVVEKALADATCTWSDIDAIAVTYAPGLVGSLLIGTLTARTLAILHNKPLYPVHHVEAHVYANFVTSLCPPSRQLLSPQTRSAQSDSADALASLLPERQSLRREELEVRDTKTDMNNDNANRTNTNPGHFDSILAFRQSEARQVSSLRRAYDEEVTGISVGEYKNTDQAYGKLTLPSTQPTFPILALIVSGGHTQLVLFKNHGDYKLLGQTQDDAVGEAFDKVAKIIGLPYPGGPSIANAALQGDPLKYDFPISKLDNPYNFSFSGLKTAVLRRVQAEAGKDFTFPSHELAELLTTSQRNDFAASFQHIAVKTLVKTAKRAYEAYRPASVVIAGGVAANQLLREVLSREIPLDIQYAPIQLCTDNAAMIATLGYYQAQATAPCDPYTLEVIPSISMRETAWNAQ